MGQDPAAPSKSAVDVVPVSVTDSLSILVLDGNHHRKTSQHVYYC